MSNIGTDKSHSTLFKYKLRQANNEKRAECIKKIGTVPTEILDYKKCGSLLKSV
jgi:hypothetical protein